jgi:hypothetical protein
VKIRPESAFELLSSRDLPEYQSTAVHLRHRATGCEIYHLRNEDAENLFSFNFRTPPRDDTGEAHILEHSVLSGSRRFPVKDPFVILLKASMNTFLNALTFPDKTIYPGSSMVEQDFYNLMLVYGDAVFFPLLREEVFMQEGHHLELGDPGRTSEGLRRTGVVYNEMRGVFSSPESLIGSWSFRSLFPQSPYGLESGGDPRRIPELTYEQFQEFHRRYYHPANCRIFLYGNIPTERHLEFLHDNFLEGFASIEVDSGIPDQPRWSSPRTMEKTYPIQPGDPVERRSSVTVNWLVGSALDPRRLLAQEVLSEVLLGNPGSPLRRALVESRLGEDLAPSSGLDTELKQAVFSAGLRGTDPGQAPAIEELIDGTLRKLRREGIEGDLLQAAIHQVEFRNREIRRGGRPYALRLLRRCLRGWLHDTAPETTLEFRRWMEELRQTLSARPDFLGELLEEVLLANPHRSTLLVRPDREQAEREEREEREHLAVLEASLSPLDREAIAAAGRRLAEFQESPPSPEDLKTIPILRKEALPRQVQTIPTRTERIDGRIPLHFHDLFTNGIVYLDLAFRLDGLSEEQSLYLPLFSRTACAAGLPGVSYANVAGQLSLAAGGFGASLEVATAVGAEIPAEYLIFRLKALRSNLGRALELAGRLMLEADFEDRNRMKDLILEMRNDFKASIVPAGHHYAGLRAASRFSAGLRREESWQGVTQLLHISGLSSRLDGGLEECISVLDRIRRGVVCRDRLILNLTAESADRPAAEREIRRLLGRLPPEGAIPQPGSGPTRPRPAEGVDGESGAEALVTATAVGYVARVMRGARMGTPESAWETVLSHFLSTDFLWERVRMRGGAYGASASPNGLEGVFTFSSYRDPNILETLSAFRQALEYARDADIPDDQVEQAVIGTVGREERPYAPGEKGAIALQRILYGISDELRQKRRDATLSLTRADLARAAARLLAAYDRGYSVILSNRSAVEAAGRTLKDLAANLLELPG